MRACFTGRFIVGTVSLRSRRWIWRSVGDRCQIRPSSIDSTSRKACVFFGTSIDNRRRSRNRRSFVTARTCTSFRQRPRSPPVASQLRIGTLIHLSGELVEATGPDIGTWRSSLSRTDDGNGACELVLVEELSTMKLETVGDRMRLVRQ